MSYLKQKPGSIEEVIKGLSSKVLESDYQDKFKKELDKAGKGIGSMTPAEKKAFFNKIDKMHSAKDEQSSEKQIDKFHKKLDNLVHKSFGHSSDEKKKEMKEEVKEGGPGSGPQGNSAKKTNFSSAQIKQAYGILNDPRYKAGNYSGAVKTINKVTPGLADHPDVKKALMRANEANEEKEIDETHMSMKQAQNQSQKDAKGEKEVIKPMRETILDLWKEAAEKKVEKKEEEQVDTKAKDAEKKVEKKPEEKVEAKPEAEEEQVDTKAKDAEKKADEAEKAKDQVQILKQKVEQEKNKQVQQRVNPETGEPLLQVGVAYKHLRDKMKKEETTAVKKENEQNKNKKVTDTGEKPSEIETEPKIKYNM
jgi:hypothetical protein